MTRNRTGASQLVGAGQWDVRLVDAQEKFIRFSYSSAASSSSVRSIVGTALSGFSSLCSSKTFDRALCGGLIAVRYAHHPDHY
jgi:hypothetical protein